MYICSSLDLLHISGISPQVVSHQGVTYYAVTKDVFLWYNERVKRCLNQFSAGTVELKVAKSVSTKWEQCKLCMAKQCIDYSGWLSENSYKPELPKVFATQIDPTCASFVDMDEFQEQAAAIAGNFFPDEPVGYPDAVVDGLAELAYLNPVDFDGDPVSQRNVIITHPEWPVMVFSQSFVDTITAWNQSIDARNQAAQAKQDAKAKSKKAQIKPTIIGTSDTSASDL